MMRKLTAIDGTIKQWPLRLIPVFQLFGPNFPHRSLYVAVIFHLVTFYVINFCILIATTRSLRFKVSCIDFLRVTNCFYNLRFYLGKYTRLLHRFQVNRRQLHHSWPSWFLNSIQFSPVRQDYRGAECKHFKTTRQ